MGLLNLFALARSTETNEYGALETAKCKIEPRQKGYDQLGLSRGLGTRLIF